MQPVDNKVLTQEEKDKQRMEAKQKREEDNKKARDAMIAKMKKQRRESDERWWREWEYSGRLYILFQTEHCKAGIHVWRPKMVDQKWDGKTIVCVAQNCKAESVVVEGSAQEAEMKAAVAVYDEWNKRKEM